MKKLILMLSIFTIQMSFADKYQTERAICDKEFHTCISKCKKGDQKCMDVCGKSAYSCEREVDEQWG